MPTRIHRSRRIGAHGPCLPRPRIPKDRHQIPEMAEQIRIHNTRLSCIAHCILLSNRIQALKRGQRSSNPSHLSHAQPGTQLSKSCPTLSRSLSSHISLIPSNRSSAQAARPNGDRGWRRAALANSRAPACTLRAGHALSLKRVSEHGNRNLARFLPMNPLQRLRKRRVRWEFSNYCILR